MFSSEAEEETARLPCLETRLIDCILLASSKYGKHQFVMKNQPGDWSQSEMVKYFESIISSLTSFSRVLPTYLVGYHAGKPIESVVCWLNIVQFRSSVRLKLENERDWLYYKSQKWLFSFFQCYKKPTIHSYIKIAELF